MKRFTEPEIEIIKLEATDIICESVNYNNTLFGEKGDDFIGWT